MNRLRYLSYSVLLVLCIFIFSDFTSAYTEYKVGDEVTYNDIQFYVIKDSSSDDDSVTLLKREPLTVEEVNRYSIGHVNKYTYSSIGTAYNFKGFGAIAYYTSETCGWVNGVEVGSGCINNYNESDIKFVVDAWANDIFNNVLIEARLISLDDLMTNLGYNYASWNGSNWVINNDYSPSWIYDSRYGYWIMSPYDDSNRQVYAIDHVGQVTWAHVNSFDGFSSYCGGNLVRPVVTISKQIPDDSIDNDDIEGNEIYDTNVSSGENKDVNVNNNEIKELVKIPNTLEKVSIIFVLIGVVLISISTIILIRNRNKFNK